MMNKVSQSVKSVSEEHMNLLSILKGIVFSYILTIPMFIIFAFVLTYTDFPQRYISPLVMMTTIISVMAAGSLSSRKARNKGWLKGAAVGIAYIFILYLISSLVFNNFSIGRNAVPLILAATASGALGGIIGINLKKNTKSKSRR